MGRCKMLRDLGSCDRRVERSIKKALKDNAKGTTSNPAFCSHDPLALENPPAEGEARPLPWHSEAGGLCPHRQSCDQERPWENVHELSSPLLELSKHAAITTTCGRLIPQVNYALCEEAPPFVCPKSLSPPTLNQFYWMHSLPEFRLFLWLTAPAA